MNRSGYENQECFKCPKTTVILDPNDPTHSCIPCPIGARCPNEGPPVFDSAVVTGQLEVAFESNSEAGLANLPESLAASLAVDRWSLELQLSCSGPSPCPALRQHSSLQAALHHTQRTLAQSSGAVLATFSVVVEAGAAANVSAAAESPSFSASVSQALAERGVSAAVVASGPPPMLERSENPAVGAWVTVGSEVRLVSCPSGYLLVNSTTALQRCARCEPGSYSLAFADGCRDGVCEPRECTACPRGATCLGRDDFRPNDHSTWETVRLRDRYIRRLVGCLAGFVLVRDEAAAQQDVCIECRHETYSVVNATWEPKVMVASSADQALFQCSPCEAGAVCDGGSRISPRENFWRLPAGQQASAAKAEVYACPLHACLEGGVCFPGRDPRSPLCGTCKEGFALSGTVCTACGDAASKGMQIFTLCIVGVLFLGLWWFFSWLPFFQKEPEVEQWDDFASLPWWKRLKLQAQFLSKTKAKPLKGYAQLFISFAQVTSTFRVNYKTEWPKAAEEVWEFGAGLSLNIFEFPGQSCLTMGWGHLGLLQVYTITPAAVCFLLSVPLIILQLLGERKRKTFWYKNASALFWKACCFWLFLIYPVVSTLTVQGFKCLEVGQDWLLEADMSQECPWKYPTSTLFLWTVVATVIYPIGIPVFMYFQLYCHHIPELAAAKQNEAVLREMLKLYQDATAGSIARELVSNQPPRQPHRTASGTDDSGAMMTLRLGGGEVEEEERRERVERMFAKATEGGSRALTAEALEGWVRSLGVTVTEEELSAFVASLHPDACGEVTWPRFAAGIHRLSDTAQLVMRAVDMDDLPDAAMAALRRFPWQHQSAQVLREEMIARSLRAAARPGGADGQHGASGSKAARGSAARSLSSEFFANSLRLFPAKSQGTGLMVRGSEEAAQLSRKEMVDDLLHEGYKLVGNGSLSIPIIIWDGSTEREQATIDRLGFLFDNYRVQYWYEELIEMARKFIMTAFGVIVTVVFLIHVLKAAPFAYRGVASLQGAMLTAQAAALFYGLLLAFDYLRREFAASEEEELYDEIASATILVFLSTVIVILPPLTLLWDNRRDILHYFASSHENPTSNHQPSQSARYSENGEALFGTDESGMPAMAAGATGLGGERRRKHDSGSEPGESLASSTQSLPRSDMVFDCSRARGTPLAEQTEEALLSRTVPFELDSQVNCRRPPAPPPQVALPPAAVQQQENGREHSRANQSARTPGQEWGGRAPTLSPYEDLGYERFRV